MDAQKSKTWTGRKVLVTGAGGFIGSHLAERLVDLGAAVRAVVHYNAMGAKGWLELSDRADRMEAVMGDVTDPDFCVQVASGRDVVFHLAALIAIPYSYEAPRSYIRTNIEGTFNMLQASLHSGVTKFIHTSTSEVYGTALYAPIDEKHPLQGQSPYSASKIAADKMVEAFVASYGLPAVVVRPFNTFGPRQSMRAVIPTIITQILKGSREIRLGSVHPTRDMNFVANTVDAFLAVAHDEKTNGRTVHFGSGREISIGDLALLIAKMAGVDITIAGDAARVRPEKSEVERLIADNTLARQLFDWKPQVSLEEGLQISLNWFKNNINYYKSNAYVR